MARMSNYLEAQLRDHIFRTAVFTKPAGLWIALYTVAPTDAGGGTEVTGGSYARVARPPSDANWTAASATDGLTDNAAVITFPAPTANWGTVVAFAIRDAATGGNLLISAPLIPNRTIESGDAAPEFAIGALDVIFD